MPTTMHAYVDPRPIQPPPMGLLASCRNVIDENGQYALDERVNPPDVENDTADGPQIPFAGTLTHGMVFDPDPTHTPGDWEIVRTGQAVRWINGFSYRPEICNGGDIVDVDGAIEGTPPTIEAQIDVRPYVVEGVDKRSTFGTPKDGEMDEARQFARRQLLACESKQIAKELWTGRLSDGSLSGNHYLSDANVALPEGGALLGYVTALAVLEREIKNRTCGQQGMIHARADTVSIWDAGGALRRVGNLILTIHDTIVVADAGYDGSAPLNWTPHLPSADAAWAYATTIVDVRRGAFMVSQTALDRVNPSTNLLTTYERRPAASTWGCLQIGVRVDHVNATSVTGS